VSKRLVDSPAVIVDHDKSVTSSMRRIMKSLRKAGEAEPPAPQQDLEINPRHPIMNHLEKARTAQPDLARQAAEQVLDNAFIAAGLLEDPRALVKRMNALLERVLKE